jgi:hypothetical protein
VQTLIGGVPAIISAGGLLTGSFTERIDNLSIRQNAGRVETQGSSPASLGTNPVGGAAGAGNAQIEAGETAAREGRIAEIGPEAAGSDIPRQAQSAETSLTPVTGADTERRILRRPHESLLRQRTQQPRRHRSRQRRAAPPAAAQRP